MIGNQLKLCNITLVTLFIFFKFATAAQYNLTETPFREVISLNEGLSQLSVNGVTSAHGYLWIATDDGLNRYNGVDIKIFDSENSKLESSTVRQIIKVQDKIYFITPKVLYQYNYSRNEFESIFSATEASVEFLSLFTISSSSLGIGTSSNFILSFDLGTEQMTKYPLERTNFDYNLYVFAGANSNGNAWLATSQGLFVKNKKEASFNRISSIPSNFAFASLSIKQNEIFLASPYGAYKYDADKDLFSDIYTKETHPDSNNFNLRQILRVSDSLYLGSISGLLKLDLNSREVQKISLDLKGSSKSPYIRTLDIIKEQLWIGTHANGLVNYHINYPIKRYIAENQIVQCMSGNEIYALGSSQENNLLFGVWGKGLHVIDENKCILLSRKSNPIGLRSNKIASIKEHDEAYWVAYAGSGVSQLSKDLNYVEHFSDKRQIDRKLTLSFPDVFDISFGRENRIWFSTMSGLTLFEDMQSSETFKLDQYKFSTEQFLKSIERKNEVWIASVSGIEIFNFKSKKVVDDEPAQVLKKKVHAQVNTLYLHNDNIWLGTTGAGIFVIEPESRTIIKHLIGKNTLPSNTIYAFEADFQGNVWASTSRGLIRIKLPDYSIGNLALSHNLQGLEFSSAVTKFDDKKTLFFAGTQGINEINVEELSPLEEFPEPQVVEISLNQSLLPPEKYYQYTNSKVLRNAESIMLPYDKSFIALSLGGQHLLNNTIKFRYRVIGLHRDWVEATDRIISFTSLSPNNYTLEMQASNSLGEWPANTKSISIIIRPPLWLTWWAKALYFILTLLIAFGLYLLRTKSLRERSKKLEAVVEKRTEELNQEKGEVERLLAYKNEEFANVSHEFRTPLTLILGPVNKLMSDVQDAKVNQKLSLVRRSGYRLLRMVDQLLFMERFRVRQESQKQMVAVHKLLKQFYESFYDLAKEKTVDLKLCQLDEIWFESLPDALEKMLLNLLSNALKYTPEGGEIRVNLESMPNQMFQVVVADTGIGIPEEMLDKVFDRYHRVMGEHTEKITGAGIGLSLVKELAIAHGGDVTVTSREGEGSTFTLFLPQAEPSLEVVDSEDLEVSESYQVELESLRSQVSTSDQPSVVEVDSSSDNQQTILVIEDNSDMRAYIAETLSSNYQVLTAENGQIGIEVAQREMPDLIISDIMMPVKDGLQVTEELKADVRSSHIPVILLTARGDRESKLAGWKLKADEYLTKPFDEEELLLRVQNLISIRDILRHRFGQLVESGDSEQIEVFFNELSATDQAFIDQINEYTEEHYSDNTFNASELANLVGLSDRQVQRKLKSLIDLSPKEMIRSHRLKRSYEKLKAGATIKAAAYDSGFSSVSYFSNCFKAQFGKTPKEAQQ